MDLENYIKVLDLCASRDIPYSGIYFPLYGYLIENKINSYLSSLFSGMIAAFTCTPMDVIKTCVQVKIKSNTLNISTKQIFIDLIKNSRIQGLFRGWY